MLKNSRETFRYYILFFPPNLISIIIIAMFYFSFNKNILSCTGNILAEHPYIQETLNALKMCVEDPQVQYYYGTEEMQILGRSYNLKNSFYILYIKNETLMRDFLLNLDWSNLIKKHKGDHHAIINNAITQYFDYMAEKELEYKKVSITPDSLKMAQQETIHYLINYTKTLNIAQDEKGMKANLFFIHKTVNSINWPIYICSYDFFSDTYDIPKTLYIYHITPRPSINNYAIFATIFKSMVEISTSFVCLGFYCVSFLPFDIQDFSNIIDIIISYFDSKGGDGSVGGTDIPIEDHLLTPGAHQTMLMEAEEARKNSGIKRYWNYFPIIVICGVTCGVICIAGEFL